ncbi:AraC family transcriptional regulator [Enterobacter hormaechei]|uniref:AraC family transcriptional regulator n=1 Tax=Enterobacter hormaechei TaxID=158836 RepID=UPI0022A29DBC|nr:helix-turn-helix transcriptional regulator [Enterobacter hormaechei]HCT5809085.1 helix-turn-helix transcriptional regulator [Enterobacter hormaechei]HCT5818975.1 helix-turn-helix transcriptional regulator [Enterobacter hormaechei]
MTTTTTFSFTHRPLVPFSHDYAHGDSEPWHQHDCAQLLHSLTGVVRVDTASGCWVVPPGRGVWLPAGTQHALRITGNVAARTLFIDPLARADLPATCQIVQISPLLRELILDEIRLMPVLPFHLPEPESEALRHLCQQIRMAPGESWSSAQAAGIVGMSERTLNRHFQQQTGLSYGEWVRRARLLEALVRLAQGQPVLRVALDLGYGSHSAFTAMFRRVMGLSPSDYFRND